MSGARPVGLNFLRDTSTRIAAFGTGEFTSAYSSSSASTSAVTMPLTARYCVGGPVATLAAAAPPGAPSGDAAPMAAGPGVVAPAAAGAGLTGCGIPAAAAASSVISPLWATNHKHIGCAQSSCFWQFDKSMLVYKYNLSLKHASVAGQQAVGTCVHIHIQQGRKAGPRC